MRGWTQEGAQKSPGLIVIVKRKNVKKFEFDAKMGPVLIAIVKREKILKSLNLMQTDPRGGPKGPRPPLDF